MKKALKVYKFGGLSLKDAEAIKNVYNILKTHPNERLIVVVSAFAKVTDALENLVAAHMRNDGSSDAYFDIIKKRHFEVIDDLFDGEVNIKPEVQSVLDDIQFQLDKHRDKGYDLIYDQVVSRGEILSSVIVSAYFNAQGLKSNWGMPEKL
jgi:aspartate kinase